MVLPYQYLVLILDLLILCMCVLKQRGSLCITSYIFCYRSIRRVLVNNNECIDPSWVSDSLVTCKTPEGVGANNLVVVFVDNLSSFQTESTFIPRFSYNGIFPKWNLYNNTNFYLFLYYPLFFLFIIEKL